MALFAKGAVREIPTDAARVHAFAVNGALDEATSVSLARHMNAVFDEKDDVALLFDLTGFDPGGSSALFDGEVLRSRLRATGKVARYAVIGAPEPAARMIGVMDRIVPVDARTFSPDEAEAAWAFVHGNGAA